jgi:Xaa-Pro aminopeptidase
MNSQIKTILARLKKEKLDGLIVFSPANISYLCGFISRDAYLLVSSRQSVYFTDARYLEEVKKYLQRKFIIRNIADSFVQALAGSVSKLGLKRLGFEARNVSYHAYRRLRSALGKKAVLVPADDLVEKLRQKKEKEELVKIRRATQIAVEALKYARRLIKPGLKEIEVAAELERFIRYRGAGTAAFEIIIASGPNSSFPHHRTGQRKIRNNEPVLIDLGVDYQGYKSDLTRIFFLGRINFSVRRIYDIVAQAQIRALESIKPGVLIEQVDASARRFISEKGFGKCFTHNLGHGVGLEVHEAPRISPKEKTKLEKGMVFTLEPAIYLPNKFGVRIEDMVVVTKEGAELISGLLDK